MNHAHSESHSIYDVRFLTLDDVHNNEAGYARGPERALMAALLFDAIQAYICYVKLGARLKAHSEHREAYFWVHSQTDKEYVFSFESVCEGLGINPNYLRLGLLNLVHSQESWKRARRNF